MIEEREFLVKARLIEDIDNAVKFNEEYSLLEIDSDGHGLEEGDIPEFLLEDGDN